MCLLLLLVSADVWCCCCVLLSGDEGCFLPRELSLDDECLREEGLVDDRFLLSSSLRILLFSVLTCEISLRTALISFNKRCNVAAAELGSS